jgi:hypothetical protein
MPLTDTYLSNDMKTEAYGLTAVQEILFLLHSILQSLMQRDLFYV